MTIPFFTSANQDTFNLGPEPGHHNVKVLVTWAVTMGYPLTGDQHYAVNVFDRLGPLAAPADVLTVVHPLIHEATGFLEDRTEPGLFWQWAPDWSLTLVSRDQFAPYCPGDVWPT